MRRRDVLTYGLSSFSIAALHPLLAAAQGKFPESPIRVIVPRTPGGVVDVVARLWADKVKPQLGSIVIENQGGGGGTIAAAAVARAQPDGYTLLAGTTSELVINPVIMRNPTYDPIKDLTPIAINAVSISSLMVHASVPAKTLPELITYAKANPGKLSYGSAGTGTPSHLCGELFKQLAGLPDIVHVPYKSAGPGLADLLSGHIPMMAASISPSALDMHRTGKIRILVAGTNRRLAGAPDVPINTDVGMPDLITLQFIGLFAPGGTPQPIIEQIGQLTVAMMEDEDVQKRLIKSGFEPIIGSGPAQSAKYVSEEIARWTPVLKATGIKIG